MNICDAKLNYLYEIKNISANSEMKEFLFSLGCFEGEQISIIKIMPSNFIINIKGVRYAIDKNLGNIIELRGE
ncbi:MAG: ferrous iron transport protein A [Peptostreptococcaceae bacterium]